MKVIIMMGLPGSGKSTWAKSVQGRKVIVSSDNYFTDPDGNYNWTIEEAHKGHEDCLRRFIHEFQSGPPSGDPPKPPEVIIVDNTNVRIHDISPYIRIAQAYGCDVEVKYMDTNVDNSKTRNIHGVPDVAYDRMQKNFAFLLETWPKDFPPIEFVTDTGWGSIAPAYGCLWPEEQTEFDVILVEAGPSKIRIVKWFRENTKITLKGAIELAENSPKKILSEVSEYEANKAKQQLEALGAKIEIR
jgi:ribosomal protein L7/L12/predicted kinase